MDFATRMEVYEKIFEIWKMFYTRGVITAALLGFSLGVFLCMFLSLGSFTKKKKKDDK